MNPAIIGDIYPSEERGSGMSLVMLAPLIGGTIGPAIGGAMAETLGWRIILWICAGCAILCEISFFIFLRETYKVTILQRRAAHLRKITKDDTIKCVFDAKHGAKEMWWPVLRKAILRPVVVMWDSVVLQMMAFYAGFTFTFYYIMATTLPGILRDTYGFSDAGSGSAFICFSKFIIVLPTRINMLTHLPRSRSSRWHHSLQRLPRPYIHLPQQTLLPRFPRFL